MRNKSFVWLAHLGLVATLVVACGDKQEKPPVTEGDDDQQEVTDPNNGLRAPAPWTNVTFTTEDAELSSPSRAAGERGKLVRGSDGTLYYTYYKVAPNRECDIALFAGGPAPSVAWDIRVAVKAPGAASFSLETLPLASVTAADNRDYITNPNGLDAVFTNGNLVIAAPAGGDGQFTCGSTDLVIARRTAANTYAFSVAATDSGDGPGPTAGVAIGDPDERCPEDGACDDGDDVGAWASIAIRSNNTYAIGYVDTHFTTDEDGLKLSDFELWEGASFGPGTISGIRMWSGGGRWAVMREINNQLVTAYSSYPAGAGAYVLTRQSNGTWTGEDQSFGAEVGERLQLEVAPNGTVGLAYYAVKDNTGRVVEDLYYCESADNGVSFPTCSRPETATLIAGANPSLAYDSQSRPVLSYYYCGSNGCPNDGLRVAWRDNTGKWWKYNIRNIANNRSGYYSSVVIDPATDEPIIAFQDLTRGAAMVAYGKF